MPDPKLKSVRKTPQNSKVITRRKAVPVRTAYSQAEREEIFRRFSIQRPEPRGELAHTNPFTLVVAVALSAQATDAGVNKATRALFKVADTPEKMLALGEERLRDHIRTIGLYRNKAKNVMALSQMLVDEFGGEVPHKREELVRLPGVGRKTANVVLSMAFGQATMAVDTHIFRIANRIKLAPGKTPDEVEDRLMKVIPESLPLSCPPLADPARPLHVQGAPPGMRALRDRRSVQIAGKELRHTGAAGRAAAAGDRRGRRIAEQSASSN